MLIHKDEIHKGDLRNFLSLIYSLDGLFHFWKKKILEQSPMIKTFLNVLQYSFPECYTQNKVLQYSMKILQHWRNFQIILFPSS